MFTKAGVKGQDVGFLFTDNQIVQERFLVRVNSRDSYSATAPLAKRIYTQRYVPKNYGTLRPARCDFQLAILRW